MKNSKPAPTQPEPDPQFEILLEHVKRCRGFDFTGYKRSSLMRRVDRRLQALNIESYVDYVDFLEVHPQEFEQLFNTILINVTSFFRDKEAWEFLEQQIIPKMLDLNGGDVRIWSAGCASGEEAFSIAILMCEAMGEDAFHKRVKIYATDVDEEALMHARLASFDAEDLKDMKEEWRSKYFTHSNDHYVFRTDLRRSIIFGRHDLVQDAPISKLDLLSCRNTLMYLNAETQARILARMHFALKDEGYLFLGKAEMILNHANLFNPLDSRYRVFSKACQVDRRNRLLVMAQSGDINSISLLSEHIRLRETAFRNSLVAQIVIDKDGNLCIFNNEAAGTFRLGAHDAGRRLQDLEISYRPVELRSMIEQAVSDLRTIRMGRAPYTTEKGDTRYFDVQVVPICPIGDKPTGTSITFHDVTNFQRLYDTLKAAHEELETTNEELQSTNEELETTNEELQSTNEELETTNEELQSTNEELETTHEELQSTNEELETTSQELLKLTEEVASANSFLECIVSSMQYAVVVLDNESKVRVWNNQCERLWGVRADETIEKSVFELDIGLPVEQLREPIRKFHDNEEKSVIHTLDAVDRRGRKVSVQIRMSHLHTAARKADGLVLLMVVLAHPDEVSEQAKTGKN